MGVFGAILNGLIRLCQIAFAVIIAAMIGIQAHNLGIKGNAGIIYTIVLACFTILTDVILIIPCTHSYNLWPIDFAFSLLWFGVLAFAAKFVHSSASPKALYSCPNNLANWSDIGKNNVCSKWKLICAFSLLLACLWILSTIVQAIRAWRRDRYIEDKSYAYQA